MPLDRSILPVVRFFRDLSFDASVSAKDYREKVNGIFLSAVSMIKEDVAEVEDRTIKGRESEIRIRIYRQKRWSSGIVFYHGGGFVIGNIDIYDPVCRRIARIANATVVSVDYRLAPEHKFPSAVVDAYDALKWVVDNANDLEIDADKIAVVGDSAGGNLATVVSLIARDEGENFIKKQILVYPVVNMVFPTVSRLEFGDRYGILTTEIMRWFTEQYLRSEEDKYNPLASPIFADLSNLPPALIMTAEYDPLRDEGEMYGELMRRHGSEAVIVRYQGMIHGFLNFYPLLRAGREAINQIAVAISEL
ncbi:MAG: alpha/beta hydrolase [Archaeoglobaceae archaeon]